MPCIFKDCAGAALTGVGFGLAMEKSGVYLPGVIRSQFDMSDFTMLRMFTGALSASAGSLALIKLIAPDASIADTIAKSAASQAVGGAILGAGMYISGSCPASTFVQFASAAVPTAAVTLAGSVAGAFAHGMLSGCPVTRKVFSPLFSAAELVFGSESAANDAVIDAGSYAWKQFAFAAAALGMSVLAGKLPSGKGGASRSSGCCCDEGGCTCGCGCKCYCSSKNPVFKALGAKAWSPTISGLALGANQLPLVLLGGIALGGSTTYSYIAAKLASVVGISTSSFKEVLGCKLAKVQLCFAAGVIAGARASVKFAGSCICGTGACSCSKSDAGCCSGASAEAPKAGSGCCSNDNASCCDDQGKPCCSMCSPTVRAFVGGAMLAIGARIANGCTSGHGLSGTGSLSIGSFIATGCMFAGGMATAVICKSLCCKSNKCC